MPTNPDHGYLTEPRWMATRNTVRELVCWRTWAELGAVFLVIFAIGMVVR